mgnify:CR=1 FL=1
MTKAEALYFKIDVPCGAALYVQELETDEHYVLSGKKYPVAFEYAGQDTAKVEIKVNHGEPIENNLKYGKISGWKADQDGFGLGGAKIGLFRAGETEFTEETALMVTESNPIGYFEFNKVPAGSWEIHEIAPPKAFVLNEEIFPAEITEDGETIEITIQNQIIRGTVETTKADADYPENKLTGAVFEVYADVDSNGEFNPDIDLLAGELAESDPGHYQLKDLVHGDYFLHEQKAPEFFGAFEMNRNFMFPAFFERGSQRLNFLILRIMVDWLTSRISAAFRVLPERDSALVTKVRSTASTAFSSLGRPLTITSGESS